MKKVTDLNKYRQQKNDGADVVFERVGDMWKCQKNRFGPVPRDPLTVKARDHLIARATVKKGSQATVSYT